MVFFCASVIHSTRWSIRLFLPVSSSPICSERPNNGTTDRCCYGAFVVHTITQSNISSYQPVNQSLNQINHHVNQSINQINQSIKIKRAAWISETTVRRQRWEGATETGVRRPRRGGGWGWHREEPAGETYRFRVYDMMHIFHISLRHGKVAERVSV